MSYLSYEELETNTIIVQREWESKPLQEEVVIPNRSVRFRDNILDVITFEKDSPPTACSEPDTKFQVPCDTISGSSSCIQTSRVFTLIR
jgi:hypothetical protein